MLILLFPGCCRQAAANVPWHQDSAYCGRDSWDTLQVCAAVVLFFLEEGEGGSYRSLVACGAALLVLYPTRLSCYMRNGPLT